MKELARRQGRFGVIRVLERSSDHARLYCVGDGVQSMRAPGGESLFGHVHALKMLLHPARDVLVLGGGGGSLPTMLARRGHAVTVVDIDPAAHALARRYFGLDPRVAWISADAVAWLRRNRRRFSAIVIDACDAEGTVGAVMEPDWLEGVMRSLTPDGSLLVNLVCDDGARCWRLGCEMAARGLHALLFSPQEGEEGNELLHLSRHGQAGPIELDDIARRPEAAQTYLRSLRLFRPPSPAGEDLSQPRRQDAG